MLIRVIALSLVACCASGAPIEVTDDVGEQVVLSGPAQRIVSLAPHITEILFELGVGGRIVGTVKFSDYPEAAKSVPRVGDAFSVNVEAIVNMRPDIVFAWATGGANQALARLRELGVPVYVSQSKTLASIADTTRRMSRLVGMPEHGDELADRYLAGLAGIRRSAQAREPVRVFFQISDRDLYTVSRSHLIGQAITLCGGINPFGEAGVPVPLVSQEAVVAADPDVIIISQPVKSRRSPWIEKWQHFGSLNAKIRTIDPDLISRPSLRMLEGVKRLCRLIHEPEE